MLQALSFGVSVVPTVDIDENRAVVAAAEQAGLDLVGVQDHPYVADHLDAFALIGDFIARTGKISFFPDVANLPLRPAPMLARQASALSRLSGGRFHLGLGAGGYWDAITKLGVPRRSPKEALDAQAEAIALLRGLWQPRGHHVTASGDYYSVDHMASQEPGPGGVEIWIGAQGPRSLALTGRVADGWAAPIPSYLPYEKWAESNALIDRVATDAGREPGQVRRIAQLVGTVTDTAGPVVLHGAEPIRTDARGWADVLTRLAAQSFTGFVLWPEDDAADQARRFGEEVAPAVRVRLGQKPG
ncbi:LLM class flavin-dependent oxidoreductase [Lentzea sp. NEAU-D7]|uniref:LLM class flavin-dependent oxidoreductase n=1 Tax=Lentzea sp. NEAU-D7 TaxID=2994667 RepID=UPI00224AFD6C|nr:LLM class flavin-dependent oxidoreductase [Lentzea sp. NEAU-D7]MCX2947360.1 LLM class flavin-dependent oxidoreductase [Lentzea sp. NEAU-D7]